MCTADERRGHAFTGKRSPPGLAPEGAGKEEELPVHRRSPEHPPQERNLTTGCLKRKLSSSSTEV